MLTNEEEEEEVGEVHAFLLVSSHNRGIESESITYIAGDITVSITVASTL